MEKVYSRKFFENKKGGSLQSAKEIIPLILELIQAKRVIDVGCGTGEWLSVFMKHGISDILGVDGDWVDKNMLLIPKGKFLLFDLRKPLRIDKQFDLVISLEVAEHLPKECAETFVDSLTRLGPVILFSAAIPFQGGTHHINEQWPEYWIKFFHDRGYVVIDCLRKKIWNNNNVEFWYAQNILMFVRKDYLKTNKLLQREFKNTNMSMLSVVHPKKYLSVARNYDSFNSLIKMVPSPIRWVGKKLIRLK